MARIEGRLRDSGLSPKFGNEKLALLSVLRSTGAASPGSSWKTGVERRRLDSRYCSVQGCPLFPSLPLLAPLCAFLRLSAPLASCRAQFLCRLRNFLDVWVCSCATSATLLPLAMGDYEALSSQGVPATCARHPVWVVRGISVLISIIGYLTHVNKYSTLTGILGTAFGLLGNPHGFRGCEPRRPKAHCNEFSIGTCWRRHGHNVRSSSRHNVQDCKRPVMPELSR